MFTHSPLSSVYAQEKHRLVTIYFKFSSGQQVQRIIAEEYYVECLQGVYGASKKPKDVLLAKLQESIMVRYFVVGSYDNISISIL